MMVDTPWISVVLVLIASILGAVGQFIFQSAAKHDSGGIGPFLGSYRVWAGVVCYVIVMVLFTMAFKKGGTVRVLYPIYATTFIWAALMAWGFQCDPIRPLHVVGMVVLIGGIMLMSW